MRARRAWGWPLVPAYAAAVASTELLRRLGLVRTRRLAWPVVSVGSLSAGGAGKTPVVMALAELLQRRGWQPDVLSRGYGRSGSGVARVDAGIPAAAEAFGDEPVLIARSTGAAVWVGADRWEAGRAAEDAARADGGGVRSAGRGLHLLDDGLQHRRLARAMDVAVLTAEDLTDALLPAGNRREPMRALRRADVIVLRAEEAAQAEPAARRWLRPGALVWQVSRTLVLPAECRGRLLAFCGLARPEGLWAMLAAQGCAPVRKAAFRDHHPYSAADVERLAAMAAEARADAFVTTEKDAVKLTPAMLERLGTVAPVCVARLETRFLDEDAVAAAVEARLR